MVLSGVFRRGVVLVAGLTVLAGAQVVAGASQAQAFMPGLRTVESPLSAINSVSPKTALVSCPAGKVVVGVGGRASTTSGGPDETKVVLTRLQPIFNTTTGASAVSVRGEEVAEGTSANWYVQAWAVCASKPNDYKIVSLPTTYDSTDFKSHAVACPGGGGSVIGSGASIFDSGGQVTLQTFRPDYPRGIARAVAQERNPYSASWSLTSYAICGDRNQNGLKDFTLNGGPDRDNGRSHSSTITCSGGRFTHGAAAVTGAVPSTGLGAPRGVALNVVLPRNNNTVDIGAVQTISSSARWEASAHAVCG